eukprot:7244883-Pyramimonas_sp.AAC.1
MLPPRYAADDCICTEQLSSNFLSEDYSTYVPILVRSGVRYLEVPRYIWSVYRLTYLGGTYLGGKH